MTKYEALKLARDVLLPHKSTVLRWYTEVDELLDSIDKALAQPAQEPFFTEANGFPQEFVPKDRQKQAIISVTDQLAALVWERGELQKQVWLYEQNGVTCQTYRHKIQQSCSECNVQMNYSTPPQRPWVGMTDEEIVRTRGQFNGTLDVQFNKFAHAIEAKLKERNT